MAKVVLFCNSTCIAEGDIGPVVVGDIGGEVKMNGAGCVLERAKEGRIKPIRRSSSRTRELFLNTGKAESAIMPMS